MLSKWHLSRFSDILLSLHHYERGGGMFEVSLVLDYFLEVVSKTESIEARECRGQVIHKYEKKQGAKDRSLIDSDENTCTWTFLSMHCLDIQVCNETSILKKLKFTINSSGQTNLNFGQSMPGEASPSTSPLLILQQC